ncbi:MAG: NADH-quinone oxidoreductase subunit N [Bacteroidales bacterium]
MEVLYLLRNEMFIVGSIILLLILKLLDADKNTRRFLKFVNWLLFVNLIISLLPVSQGELFHGFFRTNYLIDMEKSILDLGILLISLLSSRWLGKHPNILVEFFILLLSSLLGGFMMLSAGHLLMLYIGIETSAIPLAALANFNKDERRSSETGIKFILSSSFASGLLLYGISMFYGAYGNLSFSYLQYAIVPNLLTIVGFSFVMGGFFFKLSAVPFHFWAADVYEGSPMPVTTFLAVISKGSMVFIFVSVLVTVFQQLRAEWEIIIAIVAALSMTIGNLFAMRQTNLKRLMAFSSVSQVGFILVGITGYSVLGVDSTIYFMLIYMFSNIVCFGIIGAVADSTRGENLEHYRGFYKTNPFFAILFAIALFSLAGIPPTSGFFGKLLLLTSSMSYGMYVLVGIAGINIIFSLYNYMRIIKRIFFMEPQIEFKVPRFRIMDITLVFCAVLIIIIGFIPIIYQYIDYIVKICI